MRCSWDSPSALLMHLHLLPGSSTDFALQSQFQTLPTPGRHSSGRACARGEQTSAKQSYNTQLKGYPCVDCGKVFTWNFNLNKHRRYECGKEPQFPCPYCKYRSKQKGDLKKHIRRRHQDLPEPVFWTIPVFPPCFTCVRRISCQRLL